MHKQTVFIPIATLVFVLAAVGPADCKERTSSGSRTVERSVEVWHGERHSTTTWKNPSGRQGDVRIKTTWDPDKRKDAHVEETSDEAVAKPEDGSVTQEATAAEPNGKAVDVEQK